MQNDSNIVKNCKYLQSNCGESVGTPGGPIFILNVSRSPVGAVLTERGHHKLEPPIERTKIGLGVTEIFDF